MRLLIYGFGPYKHFQDNITETIVRRLPRRKDLKKIVFPVRFQKSRFVAAVRRYDPDVILGLGQCSRGRLLRIETRAANRRRDSRREKPRPIVARGRVPLSTSLRIKPASGARISRNAGDYVCNYSMYVVLDYLKRRHMAVRYGFIHVPRRYNLDTARRFVLKIIGDIR